MPTAMILLAAALLLGVSAFTRMSCSLWLVLFDTMAPLLGVTWQPGDVGSNRPEAVRAVDLVCAGVCGILSVALACAMLGLLRIRSIIRAGGVPRISWAIVATWPMLFAVLHVWPCSVLQSELLGAMVVAALRILSPWTRPEIAHYGHPYALPLALALADTIFGLLCAIIVSAVGYAVGLLTFRATGGSTGRCSSCGYDLTANVSGRCPECGEPCVGSQPTAGTSNSPRFSSSE